ncbi:MAG: hypothetical protein ABH845_06210, partial [Candidatus Omnitrophota bacterium]
EQRLSLQSKSPGSLFRPPWAARAAMGFSGFQIGLLIGFSTRPLSISFWGTELQRSHLCPAPIRESCKSLRATFLCSNTDTSGLYSGVRLLSLGKPPLSVSHVKGNSDADRCGNYQCDAKRGLITGEIDLKKFCRLPLMRPLNEDLPRNQGFLPAFPEFLPAFFNFLPAFSKNLPTFSNNLPISLWSLPTFLKALPQVGIPITAIFQKYFSILCLITPPKTGV